METFNKKIIEDRASEHAHIKTYFELVEEKQSDSLENDMYVLVDEHGNIMETSNDIDELVQEKQKDDKINWSITYSPEAQEILDEHYYHFYEIFNEIFVEGVKEGIDKALIKATEAVEIKDVPDWMDNGEELPFYIDKDAILNCKQELLKQLK